MWDCVAFDEVAGIKFKDKDGIQIMKGYMASGAFSRGKAEIQAKASMVFVGNIQSVCTFPAGNGNRYSIPGSYALLYSWLGDSKIQTRFFY